LGWNWGGDRAGRWAGGGRRSGDGDVVVHGKGGDRAAGLGLAGEAQIVGSGSGEGDHGPEGAGLAGVGDGLGRDDDRWAAGFALLGDRHLALKLIEGQGCSAALAQGHPNAAGNPRRWVMVGLDMPESGDISGDFDVVSNYGMSNYGMSN
jgi:hypothetical protein